MGVRKTSKRFAANSPDAIARASSPATASSSPGTRDGASPENHGTTSRSASTVSGGAFRHAIGGAVVSTGISVLSLMMVAAVVDARYNCTQNAPAEGRARWEVGHD